MAEAGDKDNDKKLRLKVEEQVEEILRKDEAKGLYIKLNDSLGKITTPELEGVGTFIVYSTELEDPLQESKIRVEIKHDKDNKDSALRTTIVLGNKGYAFYEKEYIPKSGLEMTTKGLSGNAEDAEAALKGIKEVVGMIESAASKRK